MGTARCSFAEILRAVLLVVLRNRHGILDVGSLRLRRNRNTMADILVARQAHPNALREKLQAKIPMVVPEAHRIVAHGLRMAALVRPTVDRVAVQVDRVQVVQVRVDRVPVVHLLEAREALVAAVALIRDKRFSIVLIKYGIL
jgi:hypothetical protein